MVWAWSFQNAGVYNMFGLRSGVFKRWLGFKGWAPSMGTDTLKKRSMVRSGLSCPLWRHSRKALRIRAPWSWTFQPSEIQATDFCSLWLTGFIICHCSNIKWSKTQIGTAEVVIICSHYIRTWKQFWECVMGWGWSNLEVNDGSNPDPWECSSRVISSEVWEVQSCKGKAWLF